MNSMADNFFLPIQGLHRHPENGFWRNFPGTNYFELKSPQHSVKEQYVNKNVPSQEKLEKPAFLYGIDCHLQKDVKYFLFHFFSKGFFA